LRKAYAQIERQQADYNEEVRKFKKDSEQAKDELLRVEKELARLRIDLAEKEELLRHYEDLKKDFGYLELQNETLSQTLNSKENTVKELERHISMRMEATLYQQSCSSGSTPLADETESLADIRPPFTPARPYTKAHSTVGATMSPQPRQMNVGNLIKSLSNYAIDGGSNRRDDVSEAMSRSLRFFNSRLLVKCLKETVERLARGENPDISRLLGIKMVVNGQSHWNRFSSVSADSMSESEAEQIAFDSTAMTIGVAEKMVTEWLIFLFKHVEHFYLWRSV
uniref:NUDE_C domain-containing protein n=1 Tax=Angiostrongylus cantonensis TaxID=6313 RepID=A0A0K0D2W6_ANGCA